MPGKTATVVTLDPVDEALVEISYRDNHGNSGARAIFAADAERLATGAHFDCAPAFDADADEFRLAAEALPIKYAAGSVTVYSDTYAYEISNVTRELIDRLAGAGKKKEITIGTQASKHERFDERRPKESATTAPI